MLKFKYSLHQNQKKLNMPTFRQDTKTGGMVPMMKTDDYNDQSVTEEKLKDGAITTRKIADGSVTKDKLDSSIRQEINDSVTASNEATEKAKEATAKADQATENAKQATVEATAAKEAADTATQLATNATTASTQATEQAKAATTKAEEATAKANEAAKKADDSREQTEQTLGTMQEVVDKVAIKDEEGTLVETPFRYIQNEEFIFAKVDAEDRLLFGIQWDATPVFGKTSAVEDRLQSQVTLLAERVATIMGDEDTTIVIDTMNELKKFFAEIENTETLTGILANLNSLNTKFGEDIKKLQDTKVDKEEGKSLIEDEVKECFRVIENEEFIKAIVDAENKVLFGFYRATGKPYYPLNEMYHVEQNEEFLWVILDAANHPLLGIQQDGTCWAAKAQWLDDIETIKSDIIKLFAENKVDLRKKKISILGDSLSTFAGYIPSQNISYYPNVNNDVNSVEQTWWDILLNTINATLEINNSFSGAKVSGTDASSFITRHTELGNPEYIIIHGGTNDASWANVPAGELHFDSPLNDLNINEFSDAYDFLIRCILDKYKHTNIILVIPSIVSNEYANSIISICEHYQLFGYVDLRNITLTLSSGHYQKDSMQVVAEKVLEVISKNKNVERVFGKSLIDEEYASSISSIDNEEYLAVEQDADGKVLSSTNPDGSHYILNAKSETIPEEFSHIEDPEGRTEITTDAEDKILGYRDSEGTRHEHKISANHINLSDEAAKEVNEAFKSAGIKMENPSDFSKDSHIELPIPRIAAQVKIYAPKLPTTKQDDIEAEIEYNDKDGNYFRKPVILNSQGSSSMGYIDPKTGAKGNIAIDINDGSKIKFGDFPTQDSFHLKKYYIDAFRGQCVVSYWLMEQVYQSRPAGQQYPYEQGIQNDSTTDSLGNIKKDFFTGAKCHPDGFPIVITWVNINNNEETWMGVYAWNLKKSKEVYNCDKKKAENIILDGAINNSTLFGGKINWTQFEIRNPKGLIDIDGNKYDGDSPKELSNTDPLSKKVKDYLTTFSNVVSELAASNTKETFEKFFKVKPFIDYWLVSQIIYHHDGFSKNWIWLSYDGKCFMPSLYDADSVFGMHYSGNFIIKDSEKNIVGETAVFGLTSLYSEEIAARYSELRKVGIFSVGNIVGLLNKWINQIGYDNLKKDLETYPETPSYRNGYLNDGWICVADGWGIANDYDSSKTYSVGERCKYQSYVFEATKVVHGVPPISKIYDNNPSVAGFYNSPKRVYNWLVKKIESLDKLYNYK